jgi:hypothetical protein
MTSQCPGRRIDTLEKPAGPGAGRQRWGRYIPSVDHQTPPGVSLGDYNIYIRLFREYCETAVKG